ncbi:MAG: hypothetical protein ACYSW8_33410 [Planctomycetota bacterium]|jgi:hypothetical protein
MARGDQTSSTIKKKTREALEEAGYIVGRTEYWQSTPFSKRPGVRIDLFGCLDYLAVPAIHDGLVDSYRRPLLGVQVTVSDRCSEHRKKAAEISYSVRGVEISFLEAWLLTGNRFEVWAWRQRVKDGRWKLTVWKAKIELDGVYFEKGTFSYEGNKRSPGASRL